MAKIDIEELLWEQEHMVGIIGRKISFLKAYDGQILRLAGKQDDIRIKGITLHQVFQDSYSMLVIDLSSLCSTLFGDEKSFFTTLKNEVQRIGPIKLTLDNFKDQIYLDSSGIDEEYMKERNKSYRERRLLEAQGFIKDSMIRIFGSSKDQVSLEDLELLRIKFELLSERIKGHRDHVAHRYERQERNRDKNGKINKINLEELSSIFEEIKELLNDMRFMSTFSTLAYAALDTKEYEDQALDLLNLIMEGSIERIYLGLKKVETDSDKYTPFKELRERYLETEKEYWLIKNEETVPGSN